MDSSVYPLDWKTLQISSPTWNRHCALRRRSHMPKANNVTVLKFGSSVLRSETDLQTAVHEIYRWWREGQQVVAVVSAFGDTTDKLTRLAKDVCDEPDESAVAALLATGEATSSALLGLSLNKSGIPARVSDAVQAGLRTR